MTMTKEMDIDEVLDEICCDEAWALVDIFGSLARDVLESWLDDEDIDHCDSRVRANRARILADIVKRRDRPLTREELKQVDERLEISESDFEIYEIEVEPPLVDEDGREYEEVCEDPRQMTLWPEEGLPPMKVRRYAIELPISGQVAGACAAPGLSLAVLSPGAARAGSLEVA